jgi:AcrR family transcriptional regulator
MALSEVALAAGAGKQTIYRRYPSKEWLFAAVIEDLTSALTESVHVAEAASSDPLGALRDTCRAALEVVTRPETVAIYRVLIAESQRFPRLVDHTMSHISEPFLDMVRRLLTIARNRGQIRGDLVIEQGVRAVTGLVTGWALRQGLLGRRSLSSDAERRAFFDSAWTIFLNGVVL